MTYLNLDPNYFGHLETKRLIARLGKGSEVLPLKLWCYTAKYYASDGKLVGHSAVDIESAVEWWGDPGKCVKAMSAKDIRFLDREGDCFEVHGWLKHNGHLSAFSARASKASKERWRKYREERGIMLEHNSSIAQESTSNAPTNPTKPNQPNQTHHPSPPASAGGGSSAIGAGSGGGIGRELRRTLARVTDEDDANRQIEVQGLLASFGVLPAMQTKLSARHDIKPDFVRRQMAEIVADPNVDDRARVLVSRLNK